MNKVDKLTQEMLMSEDFLEQLIMMNFHDEGAEAIEKIIPDSETYRVSIKLENEWRLELHNGGVDLYGIDDELDEEYTWKELGFGFLHSYFDFAEAEKLITF